jgi:hypothetical protein
MIYIEKINFFAAPGDLKIGRRLLKRGEMND